MAGAVKKPKGMYDLAFEVALSDPESSFLFITFINPHLMISIGKIQLGKSFCQTKTIQQLANQRQRI